MGEGEGRRERWLERGLCVDGGREEREVALEGETLYALFPSLHLSISYLEVLNARNEINKTRVDFITECEGVIGYEGPGALQVGKKMNDFDSGFRRFIFRVQKKGGG